MLYNQDDTVEQNVEANIDNTSHGDLTVTEYLTLVGLQD